MQQLQTMKVGSNHGSLEVSTVFGVFTFFVKKVSIHCVMLKKMMWSKCLDQEK